jgi:1-acyl-sn-glycerol-3-phosphate acyltransferase
LARLLQILFFVAVVRPFVLLWIGLSVRHKERLPRTGPAIIAANHNSHLDTLVLMALLPLRQLHLVRPVAAADYFLKTRTMAWFAINVIGILPITRSGGAQGADPLAECEAALRRGAILILFPEGSRGEPERLAGFKKGISHLATRLPEVPVVPVFMRGLGKVLPRGDWIPVPFFCTVSAGERLLGFADRTAFMTELEGRMTLLSSETPAAPWE